MKSAALTAILLLLLAGCTRKSNDTAAFVPVPINSFQFSQIADTTGQFSSVNITMQTSNEGRPYAAGINWGNCLLQLKNFTPAAKLPAATFNAAQQLETIHEADGVAFAELLRMAFEKTNLELPSVKNLHDSIYRYYTAGQTPDTFNTFRYLNHCYQIPLKEGMGYYRIVIWAGSPGARQSFCEGRVSVGSNGSSSEFSADFYAGALAFQCTVNEIIVMNKSDKKFRGTKAHHKAFADKDVYLNDFTVTVQAGEKNKPKRILVRG